MSAVAPSDTPTEVTVVGDLAPGDLAPGTLIDSYAVTGKLGQGGWSSVYAVTHVVLGRRAALKVMNRELCASPAAVERFIREARAVNLVRHPNIIDIYDIGRLPDGTSYCVMEYL